MALPMSRLDMGGYRIQETKSPTQERDKRNFQVNERDFQDAEEL